MHQQPPQTPLFASTSPAKSFHVSEVSSRVAVVALVHVHQRSMPADIAGGLGAGLRTIWMTRGRAWSGSGFSPEFTASSIPEAVDIMLREG